MKKFPLTREDIKIVKDIYKLLDKLTSDYYEEFIKCNHTYRFIDWNFLDNDNEIRIEYCYIDHYDEHCYDSTIVTIDELNGNILTPEPDTDINLSNQK